MRKSLHFGFPFQTIIRSCYVMGAVSPLVSVHSTDEVASVSQRIRIPDEVASVSQRIRIPDEVASVSQRLRDTGFPYIIKDSIVPGLPVTSRKFPHGLLYDNLRLLSYRTAYFRNRLLYDNLGKLEIGLRCVKQGLRGLGWFPGCFGLRDKKDNSWQICKFWPRCLFRLILGRNKELDGRYERNLYVEGIHRRLGRVTSQ